MNMTYKTWGTKELKEYYHWVKTHIVPNQLEKLDNIYAELRKRK